MLKENEYAPSRRVRTGVPEKELESFLDGKQKAALSVVKKLRKSILGSEYDVSAGPYDKIPNDFLDYIGESANEWSHIWTKEFHSKLLFNFKVYPKTRNSLDPLYFENGQYGFDIYVVYYVDRIEEILVVCYERVNFDLEGTQEAIAYVERSLEGFDRSSSFIGTVEDMVDHYLYEYRH